MTAGDRAFTPDGLQTGASMALSAAETAQLGGVSLARADCSGASFGQVQGAEQLAAAVVRSRDAHVRTAGAVATHHLGLHARSGTAADLGDWLNAHTAQIARSVPR